MIRWFHVEPQGIDPCAYVPGLYTQAEVDDLINIDGYIPVADAAEFDKIRTGAVETMGGCSIWAGSYTTGGSNKKYIQIFPIDFSAFGTWTTTITLEENSIYDGNNFSLSNITSTAQGLFNSFIKTAFYRNIRVVDISVNSVGGNTSGLIQGLNGGSAINCTVSGTIIAPSGSGVVSGNGKSDGPTALIQDCINYANITTTGNAGGITNAAGSTMLRCENYGTITSTSTSIGAFCGGIAGAYGAGSMTSCVNYGTVTGGAIAGGITGEISNSTLSECYNLGVVTGSRPGGISGYSTPNGTIQNCYNWGAIVGVGPFGRCGGIIAQVDFNLTITNCYNIGNITGVIAGGAGAINNGRFGAGSITINDTYYDTDVGYPTSAVGTGQTTVALQTPTSNTGIYSAWSLAIWDFGTSVEYPELINTP